MGLTSRAANPWILGLASSSHNGAACLLRGPEIVVAIQEERLCRRKRAGLSAAHPSLAVAYCLEAAGLRVSQLDLVVTCALQETCRPEHDARLNPQLDGLRKDADVLVIPHHLGHAWSAFALSGYDSGIALVVDGAGSRFEDLSEAEKRVSVVPTGLKSNAGELCETVSIFEMTQRLAIPLTKHLGWWLSDTPDGPGMRAFGGIGGMYSAVAEQIFGDPLGGPGKVMGLSAYGRVRWPIDVFFDCGEQPIAPRRTVPEAFRKADRWPMDSAEYCDLACSAQAAVEGAVLHLATWIKRHVGSGLLCYAGGVALNTLANSRLRGAGHFRDVFVPPAAEDSGTAIGAAYYGLSMLSPQRRARQRTDSTGVVYDRTSILRALDAMPGVLWYEPEDVVTAVVGDLIQQRTVGWFQGGSELGPRALGRRSILVDPRAPWARDRLNSLKGRESFRPFGPIITAEAANHWFEVESGAASPFMLDTWRFRSDRADRVPAVVHHDGTGRAQTVDDGSDPLLAAVLREFTTRTGVPLLLNTSFNVAGRPIVESPLDALWALVELGLDCCVLGSVIAYRSASLRSALEIRVRATDQGAPGPSSGGLTGISATIMNLVASNRPAMTLAELLKHPQLCGLQPLDLIGGVIALHAERRVTVEAISF